MNYCDYYVKEVLSPVRKCSYEQYEWYEVDVSYIYDNGELKERKLSFNTKEAALKVREGYHFLA